MESTRCLSCLCAAIVAVAVGSPVADAGAMNGGRGVSFSRLERCFMKKINERRRNHGMRSLKWDPQIGYVARTHSRRIARQRSLRHDQNYTREITHWKRLGQNTGRGHSCRSLSKAFWTSSTHRSNILGRWRHVGVGVTRAAGRLYVQQVFESKRNPGNIY